MAGEIVLVPVRGLPEVRPGDDLPKLILGALEGSGRHLEDGDVLVVAQKAVSKAEGYLVQLGSIEPSALATSFAAEYDKDPRSVEIVLREARRVVRMERGVLIVETRHGFVCANAGVDQSNVDGDDVVCLLPPDPDASAERLRAALARATGRRLAVIISDTFGRPWREGQTNIAIGVAGMSALKSYIGQLDPSGYELRVTALCVADELASAAELVMGKIDRVPVALVRGFAFEPGEGGARAVVRPPERDLFR
ncbi:MAG: coenzyme F420-0:L-glutamate ligase [Chloroflexi bacterium]|nr:coenzyme F420-0:L-glutamate ligase [Chloroflexota bacterium]